MTDPPDSDRLYTAPRQAIQDFAFDSNTAAVFDDMINRSVPLYGEMQRMVGELAGDFAQPNSTIYDLGCSTINTFLAIACHLPADIPIRFVGVDSSAEMLAKARAKLDEHGFAYPCSLIEGDLHQDVRVENASVVVLSLTLQFLRPLFRTRVLSAVYRGLNPGGCCILIEKTLAEASLFNRLFIKHYLALKRRNGYSEMEISQKREALENVLVPYRLQENHEALRLVGFRHVETFFQWYNFCGMVAVK